MKIETVGVEAIVMAEENAPAAPHFPGFPKLRRVIVLAPWSASVQAEVGTDHSPLWLKPAV